MTDPHRYVDWDRHQTGRMDCPECDSGFPRVCGCGGLFHREVMRLPNGGYVQMTRCDRCGMPEGR